MTRNFLYTNAFSKALLRGLSSSPSIVNCRDDSLNTGLIIVVIATRRLSVSAPALFPAACSSMSYFF